MSPFKIGDSVNVYGCSYSLGDDSIYRFVACKQKGTIKEMSKVGWCSVDIGGNIYNFHEKQLRKLKLKKRREIWINIYKDGTMFEHMTKKEAEDSVDKFHDCETVLFREVKIK